MAKPKITLFVDIVSPFGYIAFHALRVRHPAIKHTICTCTFHFSRDCSLFVKSLSKITVLVYALCHPYTSVAELDQ